MKRLRTTNDSVRIPIFTLFKGTGGSLNTKYMMTMKQIVAFEKSMDEIYVCFLKNVSLTVSVIKRAMQRFSWFVLSIFYISVMFSPLKQRVPLKALRRQNKLWYTLWSIILKQSILIQILANHICPCSFKDVADLFLNHKLGFNCISGMKRS